MISFESQTCNSSMVISKKDRRRLLYLCAVVVDDIWKLPTRSILVQVRETLRFVFEWGFGHLEEEDEFRHVGTDIWKSPCWNVAVDSEYHLEGDAQVAVLGGGIRRFFEGLD